MHRRDATRVLQSVFDDFDSHYDPDARLTAPLVEFEEEDEGNNFVLDWEGSPWFRQDGVSAWTFEDSLRLRLRHLLDGDMNTFVGTVKKKLTTQIRTQGCKRDVRDAETLEGILQDVLLQCMESCSC
jgi:hypothetical protein